MALAGDVEQLAAKVIDQFGKIDVDVRLRDLSREELLPVVELEEGDWYDSRAVDETSDRYAAYGTWPGDPWAEPDVANCAACETFSPSTSRSSSASHRPACRSASSARLP